MVADCIGRNSGVVLVSFQNLPVSWNVNLADFEVEVGHSSDRNAVASCGEVEQLLLQLQREGQHHIPKRPDGTQKQLINMVSSPHISCL